MRVTVNIIVALRALEQKNRVHIVYESGMVMTRDEPYFPCSTDGVGLMAK